MFKIENEFQNANIPRTVRFTESLYQRLQEMADEHGISFNLLVLQCCKYALEHAEQNQDTAENKQTVNYT